MRTYDPHEDLPPYNEEVYALIEIKGSSGPRYFQEMVQFDPCSGWSNKDFHSFKVLKWCDFKLPDLGIKELEAKAALVQEEEK